MKVQSVKWWGDYEFNSGDNVEWRIGPLLVGVKRLEREYLVFHCELDSTDDQPDRPINYNDPGQQARENDYFERFVFEETPQTVTVLPALADRSVVSRPFTPLAVAAGEKTVVNVGTPLWFTLTAGDPADTFFEVPIQRPSDTWFGPTTMKGESCYASRTFARLNIKNLPPEPDWASTRIHIVNNSEDPLHIERLNLPVPLLSLYQTADGRLITESVTMTESQGDTLAKFAVDKDDTWLEPDVIRVASPRKKANQGMFVTAFSALHEYGSG